MATAEGPEEIICTGVVSLGPKQRSTYEDDDFWQDYKGCCLPFPWTLSLPEVDKFQAKEGDVCVASFPKSGTGWLSSVVLMIMNDADPGCLRTGQPVQVRVPMLEQVLPNEIMHPELRNIERLKHVEGTRFYGTHLSKDALPKSVVEKAKIVYVYRNPKDVVVSMYHWLRGLRAVGFNRDIKYLVDEMVKPMGKVMYAPYFDNISGYWAIRNQPNVFLCSYEQMRKNFHSSVRNLATFLGKDLNDEQINKVCHECSFAEMLSNPVTNRKERDDVVGVYDSKVSPYLRKGAVGKWHDTLDEESSKKIDEWTRKNLSQPALDGFSFEYD